MSMYSSNYNKHPPPPAVARRTEEKVTTDITVHVLPTKVRSISMQNGLRQNGRMHSDAPLLNLHRAS